MRTVCKTGLTLAILMGETLELNPTKWKCGCQSDSRQPTATSWNWKLDKADALITCW